jgi:prolipoprotein diacylglyceryltransferase
MIICFKKENIGKVIKVRFIAFYQMAEAGMAAFGAAAGVAIALAVVCFALRGKGHPEPLD